MKTLNLITTKCESIEELSQEIANAIKIAYWTPETTTLFELVRKTSKNQKGYEIRIRSEF